MVFIVVLRNRTLIVVIEFLFGGQSPKGDISYLQKFFLMYVGGRQPLHLQEDFCGTALLRCVTSFKSV